MQQLLRSGKKQFRQLIFVGESADRDLAPIRNQSFSEKNASLNTVPVGNRVIIEQIYTSKKVCHQLRDLGLRLGTAIQVVSQTARGSAIVNVNERHIGLGAKITQRIIVKK